MWATQVIDKYNRRKNGEKSTTLGGQLAYQLTHPEEQVDNTEKEAEISESQQAQNARVANAAQEDVAKRAAYLNARQTGANKATASAVGGIQSEDNTANYSSAMKNAATGTQADYLEKMGYANALQQEASNKKAGAFLNSLGGFFQGAGTGAAVGLSLSK